jgi:hypothetical protein
MYTKGLREIMETNVFQNSPNVRSLKPVFWNKLVSRSDTIFFRRSKRSFSSSLCNLSPIYQWNSFYNTRHWLRGERVEGSSPSTKRRSERQSPTPKGCIPRWLCRRGKSDSSTSLLPPTEKSLAVSLKLFPGTREITPAEDGCIRVSASLLLPARSRRFLAAPSPACDKCSRLTQSFRAFARVILCTDRQISSSIDCDYVSSFFHYDIRGGKFLGEREKERNRENLCI